MSILIPFFVLFAFYMNKLIRSFILTVHMNGFCSTSKAILVGLKVQKWESAEKVFLWKKFQGACKKTLMKNLKFLLKIDIWIIFKMPTRRVRTYDWRRHDAFAWFQEISKRSKLDEKCRASFLKRKLSIKFAVLIFDYWHFISYKK